MGDRIRSLMDDSLAHALPPTMIARFLTNVRVQFNPFSVRAKPARLFLSLIPPDARSNGMVIETKMLPRTSKEPPTLDVKFSMSRFHLLHQEWRG